MIAKWKGVIPMVSSTKTGKVMRGTETLKRGGGLKTRSAALLDVEKGFRFQTKQVSTKEERRGKRSRGNGL